MPVETRATMPVETRTTTKKKSDNTPAMPKKDNNKKTMSQSYMKCAIGVGLLALLLERGPRNDRCIVLDDESTTAVVVVMSDLVDTTSSGGEDGDNGSGATMPGSSDSTRGSAGTAVDGDNNEDGVEAMTTSRGSSGGGGAGAGALSPSPSDAFGHYCSEIE